MTELNDYNVTLHLRVKDNPRKWIVDCIYDTLNDKLGEDILYWDVKDIKKLTLSLANHLRKVTTRRTQNEVAMLC